jgi:hypothetical protein
MASKDMQKVRYMDSVLKKKMKQCRNNSTYHSKKTVQNSVAAEIDDGRHARGRENSVQVYRSRELARLDVAEETLRKTHAWQHTTVGAAELFLKIMLRQELGIAASVCCE